MRIGPDQQLAAASRLVPAQSTTPGAAERFLAAARAAGFDLSFMWGSTSHTPNTFGHVCLLVPGAGRTMLAFTSTAQANDDDLSLLPPVIDAACVGSTPPTGAPPALAQALLEPHEHAARRAFEAAGFEGIADLLFMHRPWSKPPPATWAAPVLPASVTYRPITSLSNDTPLLLQALERSYIDTLDCPGLSALRRPEDILESHARTGNLVPDLWWIVFEKGVPEGVVLLSPCPQQGHTELVYMGLSPALRRRGIGSTLLRAAIASLSDRQHRTTLCAVDARNEPAQRLYESLGFRPTSRRTALVRALNAANEGPRFS